MEFFSPLEEFLFQEMSDLKKRQKRAKEDLFQLQRRLITRHHWKLFNPDSRKKQQGHGLFSSQSGPILVFRIAEKLT